MMGLKLVDRLSPVGRTGGGSGGTGGRNPPFCEAATPDRLNGETSPNIFKAPWGAPNPPPRPDAALGVFSAAARAFAAASAPVGAVGGGVGLASERDEGGALPGTVEGRSGDVPPW